ncbi:type IX secretion system membrane protein PorP/SprF [Cognataquiflexum rubidum]|uniref:PorP/SprF family type IX secretion system membrane protein n=1 Tax=Cognataquiflexum rubidum TaxID=2922273 RepID=UPI001F13618B|nr:type IX secretion system membrane protein PorP/SprF [Cognataquiflexum rubidum]MCH6236349.1 type IX secretion system membrane protein PorP/SprF [Cognataquiflexum rubidum]
MGKYIVILFMALTVGFAQAQDTQFSQFYAAPLFLNPAFAGSSEITRVGFNFRNQWPALDQSFVAFSAYADHFIESKNSGIGIIVNGSRESLANLQNTEVGLLYSYRLKLGQSSFLHMGIQGSYASRSASFDEVVLSTQLDISKGVVLPGAGGAIPDDRQRNFADLHTGLFYYNDRFWLGVSGHHLTQPNISYLDLDKDILPIRYSAHGGVKFDLVPGAINDYFNNSRQERTLSLAFNYKRQGLYDQLDFGMELFFDPIILGVWYRGFPTRIGLPNNEALIGLIGFSLQSGIDLGYSYDFTLSQLGWRNSGGAHEVSLRYSFVNQLWDKSQRKRLPTFKY